MSARTLRFCVHYRNSYEPCRAGVNPKGLADDDGRIPCMASGAITGTVGCDELQLPPLPPVAVTGSMSRRLADILEDRCPTCQESIDDTIEKHRTLRAAPCGHVLSYLSREQ